MRITLQMTDDVNILQIQVHLKKKIEYGEKINFVLVTYFKKWNFHIF